MSDLQLNKLDFGQTKESLKDFLRSQDKFKDYDFDGSNLSVLLDVLAYNTYQNNFYANMVASEMFLDSAKLYSSVVSHSKELNYLPRSAKSANSVVTLSIPANGLTEQVVPAGTVFTTPGQNRSYQFVNRSAIIAKTVAGSTRLEAKCFTIHQGVPTTESFFVKTGGSSYPLSNSDIDTDSIRVFVEESGVSQEYLKTNDIYSSATDSRAFFLEMDYAGRYCVLFGKDTFGREPAIGSKLKVTYDLCVGDLANGISQFTCQLPFSVVTVINKSAGGVSKETIDQIKFNAPKSIQHQERAVTARDYINLLKQRFPQIKSISVFGGEELAQQQHGGVAISVNLFGNKKISTSFRGEILSYLSDKMPIALRAIFVDPDFMYVRPNIKAIYDQNKTAKSADQLSDEIKTSVLNFSDTKLSDFGSSFYQSEISDTIMLSVNNLLGLSVDFELIVDFSPVAGVYSAPSFRFGCPLIKPYAFDEKKGIENYQPAVKSTQFLYDGVEGFIQDNGSGQLQILSVFATNIVILKAYAGTVNYETGEVKLVNTLIDSYQGGSIKIIAKPELENIKAPKERILSIREEDITVDIRTK